MLTVELTFEMTPGDAAKGLAELRKLDGAGVLAGLFEAEQAAKGGAAEFGTAKAPARPWASVAADSGADALGSAAEREIGAVVDGKAPATDALDKLGALEAKQLRAVIESGRVGGPALAPSTVKRKGHSMKLVDGGDMLRAIDHQIDDGRVNTDG